MEELTAIKTADGREFKPWASKETVQEVVQEAVQDRASVTAITSEIASGKQAIAAALTQKGVQDVLPTDSFNKLAQDIQSIQIQEVTIAGGDMYSKQLYGVANNGITPGYWNLYEVMADLLSDARFSNYGGILLAEYYKGYDSLALSGAGAGGGYYTSDGTYYTDDVIHTWTDDLDGKGNRWVAYLFATESHGFTITDTNLCPRSIHIGRHVGVIESLVNGRISEIVVTDGNKLDDFRGKFDQQWGKRVVIKNLGTHNSSPLVYNSSVTESIYIQADTISPPSGSGGYNLIDIDSVANLTSLIIEADRIIGRNNGTIANGKVFPEGNTNMSVFIAKAMYAKFGVFAQIYSYNYSKLQTMELTFEEGYFSFGVGNTGSTSLRTCAIGYITNDKQKMITYSGDLFGFLTDIILQDGWCKPLDISAFSALTKANIQAHIFDRLGVNDLSTGSVIITLANAVLSLFTQEEIDEVVERTNITIVGA